MKNRSFRVHVAQATLLSRVPPQKVADSVWLWHINKGSCRGKKWQWEIQCVPLLGCGFSCLLLWLLNLMVFNGITFWHYRYKGIKVTKTLRTKCTLLIIFKLKRESTIPRIGVVEYFLHILIISISLFVGPIHKHHKYPKWHHMGWGATGVRLAFPQAHDSASSDCFHYNLISSSLSTVLH